jgi:hypothetical protein
MAMMCRDLALKAKENHFEIGWKAFACILALIGVILSVLSSLTCQYVRYYHHHDTTGTDTISMDTWSTSTPTMSPAAIPPWEGSTEGWMGLFSYDPFDTTANVTVYTYTTHTCKVYPHILSFDYDDTASMLLFSSQISAIVAPSLGLLSIVAFLVSFAQPQCSCCCRCNYIYTIVSVMLLLASGIQTGTILILMEPSLWYVIRD